MGGPSRWPGRAVLLGVLSPLGLALGVAGYTVGTEAVAPHAERMSYRRAVTTSLWSMVDANHRLSEALDDLPHPSEASAARTATAQAALANARASVTRTARRLAPLEVPRDEGPLARKIQEVLASERAYLAAVRAVLQDRRHGTALRADCAEYELQLRLGRLNPLLPGGWRNVYGAHGLLRGGPWCRQPAEDLLR